MNHHLRSHASDETSSSPSHPHIQYPPNSPWGDTMTPLTQTDRSNTLRIAFQNTNGLKTQHNWSAWTNACSYFKQHNIDIFGGAKTNLFWSLENQHTLQRKSIKHLSTPRTVATSCNTHPSQSLFQPGGCLLLSQGKWTRRCHRTSTDPSGMGRWCHLRIEGKANIVINVVCAYRPCSPSRTETSTSNTTYLQQIRHL